MRTKSHLAQRFEVEIAKTVRAWFDAGRELVPSFITNEIMRSHRAGLASDNEHTAFLEHYTFKGLRDHVGKFIAVNYGDNKSEEAEQQMVLPGFKHIQRAYVVARDDEEIAISPFDMTDSEIDAKVQYLERRGKAHFEHADELRRFKRERSAKQTA